MCGHSCLCLCVISLVSQVIQQLPLHCHSGFDMFMTPVLGNLTHFTMAQHTPVIRMVGAVLINIHDHIAESVEQSTL